MMIRILFVEDDKFLNKLIALIFENNAGFKLFIAENEHSALNILSNTPLDVVITDLQLNSHQGGLSVLQDAHSRDLPVAVMTADVSEPDDFYLEKGAVLVIRKPFDTTQLPEIVTRLAETHG